MTKVDFYILGDQRRENRFQFACRLAEKAWRQGLRVFIQTSNPQEARHVDQLLWTLREDAFVPHGLHPQADASLNPILIGCNTDPGEEHQLLINLHAEVVPFFARFERVAEVIDADPKVKEAGRKRFRYYRDHSYPLDTHTLA